MTHVIETQPRKGRKPGRPKGASKPAHRRGGNVGRVAKLTSAAAVETVALRAEAMGYRVRGYRFEQIAEAMGCAVSTAHRYVIEGLETTCPMEAELLRRLECERLDEMMVKSYQAALTGDTRSIDAVIKIMDRRAKFLGLDAPVKSLGVVAKVQPGFYDFSADDANL